MWTASAGKPCCLSVRRANRVRAQLASSSVTCAETENFLLIVTPSALMNSTRVKPGTAGGGIDTAILLLGRTKTISVEHDPVLNAGTMR